MATLVLGERRVEITEEVILGRHRNCGLQVPDQASSRQHARVLRDGDGFYVEDLNSNNGTRLNGVEVHSRVRLKDKDVIGIGRCDITIRFDTGLPDEPPEDPLALIGREIAGYRLNALLFRGPTGDVYRAEQLNLRRDVAFKNVSPALHRNDKARIASILHDAGAAGSIHDERVVQIHECGHDDGRLWYSMELVQGDNFDQLLAREGVIEPVLGMLVAEKAAEALAVAHGRGVFHRDLRPAVMILTPDAQVKVCDVGLANAFERGAALVRKGIGPAVPASAVWYLSPEQLRGEHGDARSDVYGLGCVLFHLLTGRPPFAGANAVEVAEAHKTEMPPSVRDVVPEAPEALDKLISEMLAKNADWRHADCAELAVSLRDLRERIQAAAKPSTAGDRAARARAAALRAQERSEERQRSRRMKSLVTTAVTVVLAGTAAFIGWQVLAPTKPPAKPVPPVAPARTSLDKAPAVPTTGTPATDAKIAPAVPTRTDRVAPLIAEIAAHEAAGDWGAAALRLRQGRAGLEKTAVAPDEMQRLQLLEQSLEDRGRTWYRAQVKALPSASDAAAVAARLRSLAHLRDTTLDIDRADAESRFQVELARLGQRLADARKQARKALEAGDGLLLPGIADGLQAAFAGTPVEGLHRQFATQCREASRLGTKPPAKPAGADALAVAASMLLAGDVERGRRLLTTAPGMDNGDLLRRRELLLGRQAAVLGFDDPADLQSIEVDAGEPTLARGALTGAKGEPCALTCSVRVGGPAWDILLGGSCAPVGADGALSLSVVDGQTAVVTATLGGGVLRVRVVTAAGAVEWLDDHPAPALRLRVTARDGSIAVASGDRLIGQTPGTVPAGAQVKLAIGGMDWRLDDWQVYAAP
jgi:hypothetical protein